MIGDGGTMMGTFRASCAYGKLNVSHLRTTSSDSCGLDRAIITKLPETFVYIGTECVASTRESQITILTVSGSRTTKLVWLILPQLVCLISVSRFDSGWYPSKWPSCIPECEFYSFIK
ncbi:unnamed protein product [Onchocerca flexuosa]|uniref:Peptidase A1 domain-containing protein n=1 Tax=Onchocerca flexuosa TaxID=387005 RepID=A0A183I514_9BILA|nr:unnamed protein product [Onchocerca flexuosa]